jgi:hypothetical protein
MPSLLLSSHIHLFIPKPGRKLYEVRRELAARPGVTVLWHGRLVDAHDWRARHWVGRQLNEHGGELDPFRNYLTTQASGQRGYYGATESLASAVLVLLPDEVDVWSVQIVVASVLLPPT